MIEQDKLALRVARIQAAATIVASFYSSDSMSESTSTINKASDLLHREFDEEMRDEADSVHNDRAPGAT